MELHQLRCFATAVEEGGFKRATTRLGLTQPALSYQVKQLEAELGVTLFHRRPTGVSPTQMGRVLYEYAQEMLQSMRRAKRAVQELTGDIVGEVRIGTINSIGIYFLPDFLRKMKEQFPATQPTLLYRSSTEIIDAVLADRVDMALAANPLPDRRLNQELLIEEQISLVCGPGHPFYNRDRIKPSELDRADFINLSLDNPTGELVANYLARLGVYVKEVASTDNMETVKKMVEIGLGLSFLPEMAIRSHNCPWMDDSDESTLHRIDVGRKLTRRIVLVTWRNMEVSQAVRTYLDELRKAAQPEAGADVTAPAAEPEPEPGE